MGFRKIFFEVLVHGVLLGAFGGISLGLSLFIACQFLVSFRSSWNPHRETERILAGSLWETSSGVLAYGGGVSCFRI